MEINYVSINQNKKLIGIGFNKGFIIKNLYNKILIRNNKEEVNIIELYYNSNIIFLVMKDLNILNIWDELKKKNIYKIEKNYNIELLKVTKNNIFINTKEDLSIYNLETLEKIGSLNINNLVLDISMNYIVYNKLDGYIEILDIINNKLLLNKCHDNKIQFLKISNTLKYIATISETGKTIKIYNLKNNILVREYFRGIRASLIKYVEFDKNDETLLVYSDKKTLHLYKINERNELFFNYEYSKYRINLEYENIYCIMDESKLLYIINKKNGEVDKYEYIKYD